MRSKRSLERWAGSALKESGWNHLKESDWVRRTRRHGLVFDGEKHIYSFDFKVYRLEGGQ